MGTKVFERKILPHEALHLNCGFSTPYVRIVRMGELGNHRCVDKTLDAAICKELEADRNCLGIFTGLDQGRDAVVAHVDVEKLIYIGHPDPIGLLHQRLMGGIFQGLHLVIAPLGRVGQMSQHAARSQCIQQLSSAIGTIVGIEQKICDANQAVKGDPFQ